MRTRRRSGLQCPASRTGRPHKETGRAIAAGGRPSRKCPISSAQSVPAEVPSTAGWRRRLIGRAESGGDVSKASPEAALIEIVKVEVPIELGGSLINGIDNHSPSAELTAAT